jgi:hypothetical protein
MRGLAALDGHHVDQAAELMRPAFSEPIAAPAKTPVITTPTAARRQAIEWLLRRHSNASTQRT